MSKKLIAVIDIGSIVARLKVFELSTKGKPKEVETVRKYTSIGTRSFIEGAIPSNQIDEICDCLNEFGMKCREYKVSRVFCVATSALRESSNRDVVLERVRIRTGYRIDILDNSMERYYHNMSIRETMPDFTSIIANGTMILDIGAGSMQATVYDKSEFVFSQNTVLGSLRISGLLSDIEDRTTHYEDVLEEFIAQDMDDYHAVEPKGITYQNLIAFGGEMGFIKLLAGQKSRKDCILSKKQFLSVYEYLLKTRPTDLTLNHSIPSNIAPLLLPTALIIRNMLEYTDLETVYLPNASLSEGIVYNYAYKYMEYPTVMNPDIDIIFAARNISKRYKCDKKHTEFVEKTALMLFDCTKKYNGLSERDRQLLQLSSILHEVGKYVHSKSHNDAAHMLIKYSEIVGINSDELDIIGLVVRLYPKDDAYDDPYYRNLPAEKKVIISKLTAMLRLADALDSSHRQKVKKLKATLDKDSMALVCECSSDMSFEEWSFERRSKLFIEVLGINPQLKIRRQR